jgi:hypothetical protein
VYVSSFWPTDSLTAYLALFNLTTSSGGRILKTSNGGVSWQRLSLPSGAFASGFLDFAYFSSSDSGLAVGDPNGGCFEVYVTSDGGSTWSPRVSLLDIPASVSGESGLTFEFTFSSDSFFFVSQATAGRRLYSTGDGGRTWNATPANATAYIDYGTQTNDGKRFVCPNSFSGQTKTYWYFNGYGQSNGLASFGTDTAGSNVAFGSVFRTRNDDAYITEKVYYRNDSLREVDSFALYMCDGSQAAPFSWVSLLTTTAPCGLNNVYANYFYDQNNGWLMGDAFADTTQIIWHYQNCGVSPAPNINSYYLAPGNICKGSDTINLNHYGYASPPGGMYVINRTPDSLITPSLIASDPWYPYLWIYYDYADPSGCEAQASSYVHLDTTHTAPVLSELPPVNICGDAAPILLNGVTPTGGYYYGNAVANDTFYPAQAHIGANYAIYQLDDTATQCENTSEIEIVVENCTGMTSPATGTFVSLYPNPTSGSLTIESDLPMRTIQVISLLGEVLIEEGQINEATHEMNVGSLAAGEYVISIETAEGKAVKRLAKM